MSDELQPEPMPVPAASDSQLDAGLFVAFGPGAPAAPLPPPAEEPPAPESAGPYRVIGEIARGGMGAILRGHDCELGRDVAVKVLLARHASRAGLRGRFLKEARVACRLQHPGVVPVYDHGVLPDGRPYIAMKLVQGRTLTELLAERARPTDDLPRLLHVFEQVCQTVAYAHSQGVVHRDLKPSNVMVGAFGEVQVMDWGLAKEMRNDHAETHHEATAIAPDSALHTGSEETQAGSVMGTPAYMAPEQARGEADTLDERCDVYGLGALLCEILTGKPPVSGADAGDTRRKAAEGSLGEALVRLDTCKADRELIGLAKHCLAVVPAGRPRDAEEVANEVAAYLGSAAERVRAAELAGAEARARAEGERKRRRLVVALAGIVLLMLLAGGAGWLAVQRDRDTQRAKLNSDVSAALGQATLLRDRARGAAAWEAAEITAQARDHAQRAATLAESGPADPALTARVRELLAELAGEEKDRRLLAAIDAALLSRAEVNVAQNRFQREEVLVRFQQAFAEYGLQAGQSSPEEVAAQFLRRPKPVADALVAALGQWAGLADDPNPAIAAHHPHREWLRAVTSAADPDPWRLAVRTAVADSDTKRQRAHLIELAAKADVARQPPWALEWLGVCLVHREAPKEAVTLLRRARARHPDDFWLNERLGSFFLMLRIPDDNGEAATYLGAAVALRPDSPGAWFNLGVEFTTREKWEEASGAFDRAVELRPKYANAHACRAWALAKIGRAADAEEAGQRALALLPDDVRPKADSGRADTLYTVGQAWAALDRLDEALTVLQKAGEACKFTCPYLNTEIAEVLGRQGKQAEAVAAARRAVEVASDIPEPYDRLGWALALQGDLYGALAAYERAAELRPRRADYRLHLGQVLRELNHLPDAIVALRRAVELRPDWPEARAALAQTLREAGQFAEALDHARRRAELLGASARTDLQDYELLADAAVRLPAYLLGNYEPMDTRKLALAEVCRARKLYVASARLYAEVLTERPRLAIDRDGSRYQAARAAAQAGLGKGEDCSGLADQERVRWRKQALTWLRAELARLTSEAALHAMQVRERLRRWQREPDLAGLRDGWNLVRLPETERAEFEKLWADVERLTGRPQTAAELAPPPRPVPSQEG